jgi:uncharacterized protein (TIGR03382 family)
MRARFWLAATSILLTLGFASSASAFSVVVHVYLANAIHDEIARNMASSGRPVLRLMQPDGSVVRVTIDATDARAILDNPQYFRGGAIGPDNTVMTGLTDPSHAWLFSPFEQCDALYQEALNEEARQVAGGMAPDDVPRAERAYALGCFLHGITDNSAHHLVNFFTGETFTLYPVDAAAGGELQFSLLNVVRHIVTETKFQESLEAMERDFDSMDRARPGIMRDPLTPARLEHRIAVDLVIRVYFGGGDGGATDLWNGYTEEAVAAKIAALQVALGVAPGGSIIDTLVASPNPFEDDITAVRAYVDFLRTGGLAPADYILLIPEIIRDVKNLYMIVNQQGIALGQDEDRANFVVRSLLKNGFAPRDDFGEDDWAATNPSRFEDVMTVKFRELDNLMPAYLEAVQGISNLNIAVGLQNATREEREAALAPLVDVLNRITDINYGILFSEPTMVIVENISFVTQALDEILALIKMRIREFIIEAAMVYLDELKAEYERILMAVIDQIDERILRVYEDLGARVDQLRDAAVEEAQREALRQIGLDLENGGGPFDGFLDSVLYMNAFNSTAVVLARRDGVVPSGSGMFDGPVSFDASYQLEYNQFVLCPEIRDAVYPCGRSAGEMLQTNFRNCASLDEIADVFQPSIECHMGSTTMFSAPSPSSCSPVLFDEFNTGSGGDGSYTLAFPPDHTASGPPACYLSGMDLEIEEGGSPDVPDGGLPPGADGGPGVDPGSGGGGCGCNAANDAGPSALPVLAAFGFLLLSRRRRQV